MNKIVGGVDAIEGRYPYMGALLLKESFSPYYYDDFDYFDDYYYYDFDYDYFDFNESYYFDDYFYDYFNSSDYYFDDYFYDYFNNSDYYFDDYFYDYFDDYFYDYFDDYFNSSYYYDYYNYYYYYYDYYYDYYNDTGYYDYYNYYYDYYDYYYDYSSEQFDYYYTGGNRNQLCGGSLISSKVLLTAAHCVDFLTSNDLEIALDCTDITDIPSCTLVNVTDIVVHPEWQLVPGTFGDDLALLFLADQVDIDTVAIATPDITAVNGDIVRNIGWGRTIKVTNPPAKRLQEVDVAVVENDICIDQMTDIFEVFDVSLEDYFNASYFSDSEENYIERGNLDTVICTIGDGKSSCNGDSGGPLFYACDTEGVADIQIGVVSFGFSCGGEGVPIGFESVNSLTGFNFIVDTLNEFNIEDVQFVESFDGFCPEDPIDQVAAPTPFPTFVAGAWTCDPFFFASNDGCDCECGIVDPDCEVQSKQSLLFGCDRATEICVDGQCVLDPGDDGEVDPGDDGEVDPNDNGGDDPNDDGGDDPDDNGEVDPNDNGEVDPDDNGEVDPNDNGEVDPNDNGGDDPTDNGGDDPTDNGDDETDLGNEDDNDVGALIGAIFGSIVGVVAIALLALFIVGKKKSEDEDESKNQEIKEKEAAVLM